jgi:Domain of unknown function (DUF5597)
MTDRLLRQHWIITFAAVCVFVCPICVAQPSSLPHLRIAGTALVVTFEANAPGPPLVGILSAQEGKYVEGQWRPGRWLNGDQTHQGRHLRLSPGKFDIQRVKLYRYR